MRQVKRWRYYCDHCRKSGGSKGHMARHETGCTANPQRQCRICLAAGFTPKPLAVLVKLCRSLSVWHCAGGDEGPEYGSLSAENLPLLREAAGGCPVCMFAAMRQSDCFTAVKFDLKAELVPVWSDINDREAAREHGY